MVNDSININKAKTIASHLNSLNTKKTMTYDIGHPDHGLGQAQKCGGVKLLNGIPTLPLLVIGSPMTSKFIFSLDQSAMSLLFKSELLSCWSIY